MSIESAAMAIMATNATVTSAMVKPRSPGRDFARLRWRSISGGSIRESSILVKRTRGRGNTRWTDERQPQHTCHAAVLPLVRVQKSDAGADQIYGVAVYCLLLDAAALDGEREEAAGPAWTGNSGGPGKRASQRRRLEAQAAIVELFRYQVVVDHVECIDHRHGRRRTRIAKIVGGIGRCHAGTLARSVGKLLLQRNRSAEVKNPYDEEHQQRQR